MGSEQYEKCAEISISDEALEMLISAHFQLPPSDQTNHIFVNFSSLASYNVYGVKVTRVHKPL